MMTERTIEPMSVRLGAFQFQVATVYDDWEEFNWAWMINLLSDDPGAKGMEFSFGGGCGDGDDDLLYDTEEEATLAAQEFLVKTVQGIMRDGIALDLDALASRAMLLVPARERR